MARTFGQLRRRGASFWIVIIVVLVPLVTLAYSALVPSSYTASATVTVLTGGPDPAILDVPADVPTLRLLALKLDSLPAAITAVETLPGLPLLDRASLLRRAQDALGAVTVRIHRPELVITAHAGTPGEAAALANAFYRSLVRSRSADKLGQTNLFIGLARKQLATASRRSAAAARSALARLERILDYFAAEQIVLTRLAATSSRPVVTAAVATAIAIILAAALIAAIRGWRWQSELGP
jgi:hypothetical protein